MSMRRNSPGWWRVARSPPALSPAAPAGCAPPSAFPGRRRAAAADRSIPPPALPGSPQSGESISRCAAWRVSAGVSQGRSTANARTPDGRKPSGALRSATKVRASRTAPTRRISARVTLAHHEPLAAASRGLHPRLRRHARLLQSFARSCREGAPGWSEPRQQARRERENEGEGADPPIDLGCREARHLRRQEGARSRRRSRPVRPASPRLPPGAPARRSRRPKRAHQTDPGRRPVRRGWRPPAAARGRGRREEWRR